MLVAMHQGYLQLQRPTFMFLQDYKHSKSDLTTIKYQKRGVVITVAFKRGNLSSCEQIQTVIGCVTNVLLWIFVHFVWLGREVFSWLVIGRLY